MPLTGTQGAMVQAWLDAASTERDDLATIAEFFGIEPTGKVMVRLTGSSSSALSRVATGASQRTDKWQHIATVAAYVRELRSLLVELSDGRQRPLGDMARWLTTAHIPTSAGRVLAIDALADPALAMEARAGLDRLG